MRLTYIILLAIMPIVSFAQTIQYTTLVIPDTLKQHANAVVRLNQTDIVISSQRNMVITTKQIVSVLNEKGQNAVDAYAHYDKKTSVKHIEATIYDAVGNELKKIKRKDFRDQTAVDNATMFSDSRLVYLDYTPVQYPYTIVYESVVETSNTAFIPKWFPLNDFYVSVEKAILNVTVDEKLGFKRKLLNFEGSNIQQIADGPTGLKFVAEKIPAYKWEPDSPQTADFLPNVMMALELFNLEGVDGNAKNWTEFGKWFHEKILSGTTQLPEETKIKMRNLVGSETDPIKKARIVYDFVQQKSRYVSIQEGIGGWKPMAASDVDRLGYGDCKALTNYTLALLDAVGVTAYYTRLYGGEEKRDVLSDFVAMQSNHVILAIPNGKEYVWLECTSQTDPFGYQGTFTDDRNALIMKPGGAEVVRTTDYGDQTSRQMSRGKFAVSAAGDMDGQIDIVSDGTQYQSKASLERMQPFDRDAHYKEYWNTISNLKIESLNFQNDKQRVNFTEKAKIKASEYGKVSANRMLFVVNAYNRLQSAPKKIKNRTAPFERSRGFFDSDEIEIMLPAGFSIEAMPAKVILATKFGDYSAEVVKINDNTLLYKRTLLIKKGRYASAEYEEYRQFMEKIAKNDNAKLVLVKS